MADYTKEIKELGEIVNGGVKSVTTDGLSAQYDIDAARKRRRELNALDTSTTTKRPTVFRMNLGGAW